MNERGKERDRDIVKIWSTTTPFLILPITFHLTPTHSPAAVNISPPACISRHNSPSWSGLDAAWSHKGSGERTGGHRSDPDWLPDSDHTMPGQTTPGPGPPGSSRYGRLLETAVNHTDPSRPTVIILSVSVCKGACNSPGGGFFTSQSDNCLKQRQYYRIASSRPHLQVEGGGRHRHKERRKAIITGQVSRVNW